MSSDLSLTPTLDPFGGVPEAPRGRRIAAAWIDGFAVLGAPWVIVLLWVPLSLPFVELLVVAIPLIVLSCGAALATRACLLLPNGEHVSAGRLVTGLTVLRNAETFRVVRATDAQDALWPTRGRAIAGRIAVAVTMLVALSTFTAMSWAAYTFVFQTQNQAAAEAQWQAEEPQARKFSGLFRAELLKGGPDAGARYVVDDAAKALRGYRDHLRQSRATAFEDAGSGWSAGVYEYTFNEIVTGEVAPYPSTVSMTVEKRDGEFVITQLTWSPQTDGGAP
ncbi:MAG: hypothetical protein Q7W16_02705 [Coriobacteriia bacterium]|nr:hypothetical protein [Coriobacteriia bacterium]